MSCQDFQLVQNGNYYLPAVSLKTLPICSTCMPPQMTQIFFLFSKNKTMMRYGIDQCLKVAPKQEGSALKVRCIVSLFKTPISQSIAILSTGSVLSFQSMKSLQGASLKLHTIFHQNSSANGQMRRHNFWKWALRDTIETLSLSQLKSGRSTFISFSLMVSIHLLRLK